MSYKEKKYNITCCELVNLCNIKMCYKCSQVGLLVTMVTEFEFIDREKYI